METLRIPFKTGRIVVLGDLHWNSYERLSRDPIAMLGLEDVLSNTDALILAGDLTNGPADNWSKVFAALADYILPEKIFALPGNHDYYYGSLDDDVLLAAEAEKAGAHFVQKRVLIHGKTRFLCCTLWTDFDLLGGQPHAMSTAQRMMNDFNRIARPSRKTLRLKDEPTGWRPMPWIKPEDVLNLHQDHRAWLVDALSQPTDAAQTVVVTHHGPHPDVAGTMDALTPAFHSDFSDIIHGFAPTAWFFGHSHRRLRAIVGETDVRNVSIGYPDELRGQSPSYLKKACVWETKGTSDHER